MQLFLDSNSRTQISVTQERLVKWQFSGFTCVDPSGGGGSNVSAVLSPCLGPPGASWVLRKPTVTHLAEHLRVFPNTLIKSSSQADESV